MKSRVEKVLGPFVLLVLALVFLALVLFGLVADVECRATFAAPTPADRLA